MAYSSFEKNTTIVAEGNVSATIYTAPQAMGGMNYGALTLNIQSIIAQTAAAPSLALSAHGSNDGVDYAPATTLDLGAVTSTGVHVAAGDFPYAFIRIAIILNPNGTGSELAFMTFDLQASLTRR